MRLPKKINNIIEIAGVAVPLVVDLILNITCFVIQAPDIMERIAFVAIGVTIVLFIYLSWSKRIFTAWIIFVTVVCFFDYSFTLESTRVQSMEITQQNTTITDQELARINNQIAKSNTIIENLHNQYAQAMKRETLEEINNQITVENKKLEQYNSDYKTRMSELTQENKKAKISSNDIMNAVPTAWKERRYIALVIWALIFIGVQMIVVTSIDNSPVPESPAEPPKQKKRRRPVHKAVPDIIRQDVQRWVHWSWYRVSQHESDMMLTKPVFFELVAKQNSTFDVRKYDYLLRRAQKIGVIDTAGHVLVVDEAKAIEMIIGDEK